MSERGRQRAARGWPIAGRLRTLVFLCWAMLLVVAFTAVGSLYLQSESVHRLTVIDAPAVDANKEVSQAMGDARTGWTAYMLSGQRDLLKPNPGSHDRTTTALTHLDGTLALGELDDPEAGRPAALGTTQRLAAEKWWGHVLRTESSPGGNGPADLVQGRALFEEFTSANAALGAYLTAERDGTRAEADAIGRGVLISVAAAFASLVAMLVLGGRVARTISRPMIELRDAMIRQRKGEPGARAHEDQGSSELRSVARDFNALTEQNLVLQRMQALALGTHRITFEIARAIRRASDTQQALDVMCASLGEGLGVDRVVADTLGPDHEVLLGAQWHRADLPPLADLILLPEVEALAEELWQSTGFRAQEDLLEESASSRELSRVFFRDTGARGVVMVPIGLNDRVMGRIYVLALEARKWTTSEINAVQAVSGFVARAIVEAEHQENQREHVESVERLDRQKSDFLATVSHELRTPLTSIGGFLELLQDDSDDLSAQQQKMLEVIQRNTIRLHALIENVMVISRIEGAVVRDNFVAVSIPTMIIRVVEELSVLASSAGIEFDIDTGPEAATVLGDASSLDRAVINVLSNAIKFSSRGGVVSVRAELDHRAGSVMITCEDHGVGIPARDQPDLFTRFFRASNATNQSVPGTGLGLSIVKQIIEDHHGGRVRLTSVEGEGTTVVLILPLSGQFPAEPVGNDSASNDVFGIRA